VEVLISETARDYISQRGGIVFVRPHSHRCCSGPLTLLDTSTSPPVDATEFESFPAHGVDVRFRPGASGRPNELSIDMRGRRHPRPVAYWDGCAYKP
jgi:hypothetical protein